MRLSICLMLLALISIASASPEKIVTGPFSITFDLGTAKNYTIYVMTPLENNGSTEYSNLISVSNETRAGIYISDMKTPVDATPSSYEKLARTGTRDYNNSSVKQGTIDGKNGVIVYYLRPDGKQMFTYVYWPDSREVGSSVSEGSVEVRVVGSMPVNSSEGWALASSLLNTLHIEKASTSPAAGAVASAVPAAMTSTATVTAPGSGPYIGVRDQDAQANGGKIIIDLAYSKGPGMLEIYNDQYLTGEPIGSADLKAGLNKNLQVKVNMARVVNRPFLYAVIVDLNNHRVGDVYGFRGWPNPAGDLPDMSNLMSYPNTDWL